MIVKCALDQKVEDLSKEKRRLRRREEVKKWLTIPGISLDRSDRYIDGWMNGWMDRRIDG